MKKTTTSPFAGVVTPKIEREFSSFALVKIQDGMSVSSFFFDTNEDATAFFIAASNIRGMGVGRSKTAMWPVGHDITDPWKF